MRRMLEAERIVHIRETLRVHFRVRNIEEQLGRCHMSQEGKVEGEKEVHIEISE